MKVTTERQLFDTWEYWKVDKDCNFPILGGQNFRIVPQNVPVEAFVPELKTTIVRCSVKIAPERTVTTHRTENR